MKYLDKIKYLVREIDNCEKNINKLVTAWEKEKYLLEKNMKSRVENIKDQNEFISKMEKQVHSLKFMINPGEEMTQHERVIAKYKTLKKDTENRWNSYLIEYDRKFIQFHGHNNKEKLAQILVKNWKYRRVEGRSHCDESRSERDIKQTKGYVDEIFTSASCLTEKAQQMHQQMKEKLLELQKEMDVLDRNIRAQYRHVKKPLRAYYILDGDVKTKLKQIKPIIIAREKFQEMIQL